MAPHEWEEMLGNAADCANTPISSQASPCCLTSIIGLAAEVSSPQANAENGAEFSTPLKGSHDQSPPVLGGQDVRMGDQTVQEHRVDLMDPHGPSSSYTCVSEADPDAHLPSPSSNLRVQPA